MLKLNPNLKRSLTLAIFVQHIHDQDRLLRIMAIGMLLFWVLIIFAIVSLIFSMFSNRQDPTQAAGQSDDALQILKRRYARREINKAEFDAMRHDLNV